MKTSNKILIVRFLFLCAVLSISACNMPAKKQPSKAETITTSNEKPEKEKPEKDTTA